MDIKITFYVGEKRDREFHFTGNAVKIGRAATCDIMVNDPMVSSHHLSIVEVNGVVCVQDENSINGTFLGKQAVTEPAPLQNGSEISFCNYRLEVHLSGKVPKVEQPKLEDQANRTMMMSREDVEGLRKSSLPFNLEKKQVILIGTIVGLVLILVVLLMIPTGDSGAGTAPLKVGMLDSYFLELERKMRDSATDRANLDVARENFKLATERLKLARLNEDAEYQALLYLYKSKNHMLDINPRPPLWDEVNPKIAEVEKSLKDKLNGLFRDAWFAEKEGNRQGAIEMYRSIQEVVPEEQSVVYRTAAFRIVKLQ